MTRGLEGKTQTNTSDSRRQTASEERREEEMRGEEGRRGGQRRGEDKWREEGRRGHERGRGGFKRIKHREMGPPWVGVDGWHRGPQEPLSRGDICGTGEFPVLCSVSRPAVGTPGQRVLQPEGPCP
ncbi:hypothetical protein NHX12_012067 [Muraenolepis orangiensis]|uniref:Uncharacterized protein n=1 Tax=Muraenolepis orangiensis TaxID=630683 RepID=A0A9Q0I7U2_9TELE|nr:hypothetical protein NHX12_012067 [Muraenolepis orangiensis]